MKKIIRDILIDYMEENGFFTKHQHGFRKGHSCATQLIEVMEQWTFFPEFNIRSYDKNSESDFFFFLHQNRNIFSATLRIRIFFFRKKHSSPPGS
jgi:hypothetical protein